MHHNLTQEEIVMTTLNTDSNLEMQRFALESEIENAFADAQQQERETIEILRRAQGVLEFDTIKRAAWRGYVANWLVNRKNFDGEPLAEAQRILDLNGHKDSDASDKRRSFDQEAAYAAARMAFSRLARKAGVENPEARGKGNQKKTRAPRMTQGDKTASPVLTLSSVVIGKVSTEEFAREVGELIRRYLATSGKNATGDHAALLRHFVEDLSKHTKSEKSEAKPISPAKLFAQAFSKAA
jgi:hypothetical protein